MRHSITGIDPGLVHTGVVNLTLRTEYRDFAVAYEAIESVKAADGSVDPEATALQVQRSQNFQGATDTFIERYEPRSHFGTDARMVALVREISKRIPRSKVISNTGSKQVIRPALLELLHLKKFPATHHQDLQAAARILVYGMLKHEDLNRVLYDFVQDHLDGNSWRFL